MAMVLELQVTTKERPFLAESQVSFPGVLIRSESWREPKLAFSPPGKVRSQS